VNARISENAREISEKEGAGGTVERRFIASKRVTGEGISDKVRLVSGVRLNTLFVVKGKNK
jgi:hypothetical protein